MRLTLLTLALLAAGLAGCHDPDEPGLTLEDEFAFRALRQDYHVATTTGDYDLLRSLWAADAVFTTSQGAQLIGPDQIASYLAGRDAFGKVLVLTSESRWSVNVVGDRADYGFESIAVDLGGNAPSATLLSENGSQNSTVKIVSHVHSTGIMARAEDGAWRFQELTEGHGPLSGSQLAQLEQPIEEYEVGDELGFRRMRERFHLATTTGDWDLLRSVWADDAVFRGGPNEIHGGDAIADFMASSPSFGHVLVLTPESSQRLAVHDGIAEYAFECITLSVGDNDPLSVTLCSEDGTQNPEVEIVRHTHTSGFANRVADGLWVFSEFNGGEGPLPALE